MRKCLNMQTREETDAAGAEDAQARKRVKQGPPPPALTINTSLSFTTDGEVDLGGDGGKGSRSTSDENNSDSVAGDIDTDDTMNADGSSPRKEMAKESAWAGNTELLLDYLVRRKGRTEGWKRLRETEVEEGKSVEIGDWPWADKCALEVGARARERPASARARPRARTSAHALGGSTVGARRATRRTRVPSAAGGPAQTHARSARRTPAACFGLTGGVHLDERSAPARIRATQPERARALRAAIGSTSWRSLPRVRLCERTDRRRRPPDRRTRGHVCWSAAGAQLARGALERRSPERLQTSRASRRSTLYYSMHRRSCSSCPHR